MATTSWQHIRPLDCDLDGALERLRQDVFAAQAFYLVDRSALVGGRGRPPATIDEALEWSGRDQTHSVLDITRGITMEPSQGSMSALHPRLVEHHFGTRQPSLFQVLMTDFDAVDVCEPGTGRYFFVVTPDEPTLVVFVGCTGT